MRKMKVFISVGVLAAACLLSVLPLLAQNTAKIPARDLLMPLKKALEAAGAPALTGTQETELNTLIKDFRSNKVPQTPSADMKAARLAYENAILSGDAVSAGKQITAIVDNNAARETARLNAIAKFAVTALSVLKTNPDQTKLLQKQFGDRGVVRIIESLAVGAGMKVGQGRMVGPGMGMFGGRMLGVRKPNS
jgi:hypothetical protein